MYNFVYIILTAVRLDRGGAVQSVFLLLKVVKLGCPSVVEALLRRGADADVPDPSNRLTVTHDVAREGYADTLKVLLKYGADVNLKDDSGNLPLHLAARAGHQDVVELLAPRTAHPFLPNNAGVTPMQLASEHHRDDTACWLESYRHVPAHE